MISEEWRPVVGWEGLYQVSQFGRVRSLDRVIEVAASGAHRAMRTSYSRVKRGRVLLQTVRHRQIHVGLSGRGKLDHPRVAVLVAQAFMGWDPQLGTLGFVNGDSSCVRLDNLRLDGLSLAGEAWLPCPNYESRYEVSSLGRVRAKLSVIEVISRKGNKYDRYRRPRVLRPAVGPAGYPTVSLYDGGAPITKQVHALVCRAFHGDHYPRLHVLHRDGDQMNARAENLYWGTRQDNKRDEYIHGFAKLAGLTVEEARAMVIRHDKLSKKLL